MIRYLLVLYLGLVSVLLIDPNPVWALPLLLVIVSLMWEKKWPGMAGLVLFSLVTLGRVEEASLTDLPGLLILTIVMVLPEVVVLEMVLSPRPYSISRISLAPILAVSGMVVGFGAAIFILSRFQRIGVYLNSDVTLQVFIMMSLVIFFSGPVLLGSRPSGTGKVDRGDPVFSSTIKTNK
ncbi:MAG: hypothetical protein ACMUIE_09180 [Thermoplasmatota archaeon]